MQIMRLNFFYRDSSIFLVLFLKEDECMFVLKMYSLLIS